MFTIQTCVSKLGTKKQEFITIAEINTGGTAGGGMFFLQQQTEGTGN
jgi:hypothetical protein